VPEAAFHSIDHTGVADPDVTLEVRGH